MGRVSNMVKTVAEERLRAERQGTASLTLAGAGLMYH